MPIATISRDIRLDTRAFPGTAVTNPSSKELATDCIRPPAVVGGLRWWFRAVAGGILKQKATHKAVAANESRVFGSTEVAAVVRVSTSWESLPAENKGLGYDGSPVRYLGFGKKNDTAYLPSGFLFKVTLRSNHARELAIAVSLLDLWIEFGGVGGRWRHGLGSMSRVQTGGRSVGALIQKAVAEMTGWLQSADGETIDEPESPVLHAKFFLLKRKELESVSGEEGALAFCEAAWHGYRLGEESSKPKRNQGGRIREGSEVRHSKNSVAFHRFLLEPRQPIPPIRFAMLGMPIPFSVWNEAKQDRSKGVVVWDQDGGGGRLASPVWLRPKLEDGRWVVYALGWKFAAERGRALRLAFSTKNPRRGVLVRADGKQEKAVEDFFASLRDGWSDVVWQDGTKP